MENNGERECIPLPLRVITQKPHALFLPVWCWQAVGEIRNKKMLFIWVVMYYSVMRGLYCQYRKVFQGHNPSQLSYRDYRCNSTDPRAVTALKYGINFECIKKFLVSFSLVSETVAEEKDTQQPSVTLPRIRSKILSQLHPSPEQNLF